MSKRTDAEIIKDLQIVECQLSPENLTCDGELPKYLWKQKLTKFQKQRRVLIKELGRQIADDELYPNVFFGPM